MEYHAGRRATTSIELHCKACPFVVMVAKGDKIPPCPCGSSDYAKNVHKAPVKRAKARLKRVA